MYLADHLQWFPELGCGYYPVQNTPYDGDYFNKYREYADTDAGRKITAARVAMAGNLTGITVDIGIGCGQFAEALDCFGYDVNPVAVDWLVKNNRWLNPYQQAVDNATFWDSFEHIANPGELLANIRQSVLLTIPLFDDYNHVLRSKHYRKNEHYWYFTHSGLIRYMSHHGFVMVRCNRMEEAFGREDVATYEFTR